MGDEDGVGGFFGGFYWRGSRRVGVRLGLGLGGGCVYMAVGEMWMGILFVIKWFSIWCASQILWGMAFIIRCGAPEDLSVTES